jgi:hypothetical protein
MQIEMLLGGWSGGVGRPSRHRRAIARTFVAKAVFNLISTRQLLDRLAVDVVMRRLCSWESEHEVPHKSQFSRDFVEFADSEFPQSLHETPIETTQKDCLTGHISRDSTEIEARDKPVSKPVPILIDTSERKRERPREGRDTAA